MGITVSYSCLPSAETHKQAGVYTAVGGPSRAVTLAQEDEVADNLVSEMSPKLFFLNNRLRAYQATLLRVSIPFLEILKEIFTQYFF